MLPAGAAGAIPADVSRVITGIEPNGCQFSPVQFGLSVCKHVQLVSPRSARRRCGTATLSLGGSAAVAQARRGYHLYLPLTVDTEAKRGRPSSDTSLHHRGARNLRRRTHRIAALKSVGALPYACARLPDGRYRSKMSRPA
jgi:hypothetical protein